MACSKLISIINNLDTSVDNVINALTLGVDEVIFIYHYNIEERHQNRITDVIRNYADIKITFLEVDDKKDIERIVDKNEGIVADISGGRFLTMVLFEVALDKKLPIIYYDDEENCIKSYHEHKVLRTDVFKLSIKDIIELGGGHITNQMHHAPDDRKTKEIVKNCVESSFDCYPKFISFIQRLNGILSSSPKADDCTYYLSEKNLQKLETEEFHHKYQRLGLYEVVGNCLCFSSPSIIKMINASGTFLESYLYYTLLDSKLFDDVVMSSVIDFSSKKNRYQVVCEIDCMIIKDNRLLFVSCKSNKVETPSLNEIKMHNYTFGNKLSNSVLCTLDDLNIKSPSIYAKAKELEVAVIDTTSFVNKTVAKDFLSIIEGTYQFEKLPE